MVDFSSKSGVWRGLHSWADRTHIHTCALMKVSPLHAVGVKIEGMRVWQLYTCSRSKEKTTPPTRTHQLAGRLRLASIMMNLTVHLTSRCSTPAGPCVQVCAPSRFSPAQPRRRRTIVCSVPSPDTEEARSPLDAPQVQGRQNCTTALAAATVMCTMTG